MKPVVNPLKTLTIVNRIFFLAIFAFFAGCSSPDTYQVTVENRSGQSIDEFLLQVADNTVSLGGLQPADRKTTSLVIDQDVAIDYRFKTNETCYAGQLDEQVLTGQRGKKTIIIGERGEINIIDEIHHTETKKTATKPTQEEWALPCMIPG